MKYTRKASILVAMTTSLLTINCESDDLATDSSKQDLSDEQLAHKWDAWHELRDPDGTTWLPIKFTETLEGSFEQVNDAMNHAVAGPDFDSLSFDEAVEAYRPIMEYNGVVYTISDDDTRRLVQKMLDARGAEVSARGSSKPLHEPQQEEEPKRIYPPDTRVAVSSPGVFPHNVHADIYISTPDEPACTGFKWINHYTGATAAHCLHAGTGSGQWFAPRAWAFGYSNYVSPYNHVDRYCYAKTVPNCWAIDRQMTCDYAVVRFRSNSNNCYLPSYDHGYLGYSTYNGDASIPLTVAGYPGVGPWSAPGGVLYTGSGTTISQLIWNGTWLHHNVDTSEGQSGAPAISDTSYVRAVTRGYNPSDPNLPNNGRAVRPELITWYQSNAGY